MSKEFYRYFVFIGQRSKESITGCYLLHSGVARITVYTCRINNCSKERVPVVMLFKVFYNSTQHSSHLNSRSNGGDFQIGKKRNKSFQTQALFLYAAPFESLTVVRLFKGFATWGVS